jgi:signal transduction histidine kinase
MAAVIVATVLILPVADRHMGEYPSLIAAYFLLLMAADLLTAHLLVQQFLAGGRLSTLGMAAAYLYSGLIVMPYSVAFAEMLRWGKSSFWAEVSSPWLGMFLFVGFPVLAAMHGLTAAIPARLDDWAREHRRAAAALVACLVFVVVGTASGIAIGVPGLLPRLTVSGAPSAAYPWVVGTGFLAVAVSLLVVIRGLRQRTPVERWVLVAVTASAAGLFLYWFSPVRYSFGWYAGRSAAVVSATVVLLALLAETGCLYRRLTAAHEDLDRAHRELSRRAERLAAANDELQAADRWKSDVLSTLSHEINQPLAVISACSDELTEDWDTITEEERRRAAQRLGHRVNHLLDMAAQLLLLCQAQQGDIRARPAVLPVGRALARVTDNLAPQSRSRVSTACEPPELAVWADPVHTHEILTNFVTNAIKYSPGQIRLTAALDESGANVLLAVSDEGTGVPPTFVATLFDRFTQAGDHGSARASAGFGLYLTRLLAEANQGRVWYEPMIPHGSRFVLSLARAPSDGGQRPAGAHAPLAAAPAGAHAPGS